jgi:hypothetical protein
LLIVLLMCHCFVSNYSDWQEPFGG